MTAHDSTDPHGGMPHDPAPPEPRRIIPERSLLWRGAVLAGVATGAGWMAKAALGKSALLLPFAVALGVVGLLSAWAGVIYLTGGEKLDDHPFV